jgi:hypothetical protein
MSARIMNARFCGIRLWSMEKIKLDGLKRNKENGLKNGRQQLNRELE